MNLSICGLLGWGGGVVFHLLVEREMDLTHINATYNNNNLENWWRKSSIGLQWKSWKLQSKLDNNIQAIWNKSDCIFNLKCVLKVSWFWTSTRK
jgi:hypothetical protein